MVAVAQAWAHGGVKVLHMWLWSLSHQLEHVIHAHSKDQEIHDHQDQQGNANLLATDGRHGVDSAQQAINCPGLAAHFGRDPASDQGDQA